MSVQGPCPRHPHATSCQASSSSPDLRLVFSYVLFALFIGMAYTLLQIAYGVYRVSAGECKPSSFPQFDFYADMVMAYLQGTATGAAFGATLDLTEAFSGLGSNVNKFFNKGNVVAVFILFAFLFSTVSFVFSFLAVKFPNPGCG